MEDNDHTRCEIVKNLLREKLKIITNSMRKYSDYATLRKFKGKSRNRRKWCANFNRNKENRESNARANISKYECDVCDSESRGI